LRATCEEPGTKPSPKRLNADERSFGINTSLPQRIKGQSALNPTESVLVGLANARKLMRITSPKARLEAVIPRLQLAFIRWTTAQPKIALLAKIA
jgi:hypothetical protein